MYQSLTTNTINALFTFAMGTLFTILAHTSFTELLESLFFSLFDDGTITGVFRAMDAAYNTMIMTGGVLFLSSTYFLGRFVSRTTSKAYRMAAIISGTLIGVYGVSIVIAILL